MGIPIDRTAWSHSSRRSGGHYDEHAREYEGIRCQCRGCQASFVVSAEEQQVAYEVKKRHIWWLPALCPPCSERLAVLQKQDRDYQAQWNTSRELLRHDRMFVTDWLAVLTETGALGKPNSMADHLARLLQEPVANVLVSPGSGT